MTVLGETADLVARGYRVSILHRDVAVLVKALIFAVETLSAAHTTGVQVRQVRAVCKQALEEVSQ